MKPKNYLKRLPKNEIYNLAEFVVKENVKHHSKTSLSKEDYIDILSINKEEKIFYKNSEIFVAKTNLNQIKGSIRVLRWNYRDKLPLEKIFGINPFEIVGHSPLKTIWHIGRFAIKKECKDINLFKRLMICAITPICKNKNSIAFAECDSKLLRVLRILGITACAIGESINYLGSETIPVCMTYENLIGFYNKNNHLVAYDTINPVTETQTLHQRVVLTT